MKYIKYFTWVSIHTPTWGVTKGSWKISRTNYVSIHTPTWGVTKDYYYYYHHLDVSIHTPTWGVTLYEIYSGFYNKFQSTHLHEVWHSWLCWWVDFSCFNPHTYMRCDNPVVREKEIAVGFNPHTYMRCDLTFMQYLVTSFGFNPHTYMRCDWNDN